MDGWMDGWIATGVCSDGSGVIPPSEVVRVQVPSAPKKGIQQNPGSTSILTMTRVPSPKRCCLLRAGVCSARQSWFPVRVHCPSHTPEHPHLADGITRLLNAILHIHPHMG